MPRSTKTAAVGGRSAIARCRLARAPARSPFSRRAVPRNAWLAPAAGSRRDALPQLGHGPVPGAAVPQRDAEAVVGLGRFGPERNRALQMRDRGGQISLLAQNEAEQVVRLRVVVVEAEGVGELFAGGAQFATRRRPPARAWRDRPRGSERDAAVCARTRSAASAPARARSSPRAAPARSRSPSRMPQWRPRDRRSDAASVRARTGRPRSPDRRRPHAAGAPARLPDRLSPAAPAPGSCARPGCSARATAPAGTPPPPPAKSLLLTSAAPRLV